MRKRKSHNLSLALFGGVLAALFLAASPAHAQATVSTFTLQVSGTASAVKTGLPETVAFAGPVVITATVVTDPTGALPPNVVLQVDGRGVKGTGNKTKTVYTNTLFYNLSRPFAATDAVEVTFAFFQDAAGGYLQSKTGLLDLNLTYDTTTMSLTNATGAVGTL
jgi:hypothetical protein